jgi:LysR family hydrogen peroxide-inducible transcriptional activator
VELHQLRYVIAVAREGSFTRAADSLFLAQPSLSVQVRKLEQELGANLFQRNGRGLVLTTAGEAFLEHAERALFEIDKAREQIEEVKGLRRGRVSLGVLPSIGARLLPDILASFHRRYPDIEVTLLEQDVSGEFEQMVHAGQLDMAMIRMPQTRSDLCGRLLVREPMVVLVPPGHRLEGRSRASLEELADERFVGMKAGTGLRDLMDQVCLRVGFTPCVSVETGQLTIVWGMVRAGIGVSVLPRLAAGTESPIVRIVDDFAERRLGVVWRADQPLVPPAQAFLQLLLESASPHSID